ncbi:MAG: M23 family metallopeptidase [Alphaproteobacteria bacterium]|nr:M23 family metallopeptidase [Alphaproteobacteria bacterium]
MMTFQKISILTFFQIIVFLCIILVPNYGHAARLNEIIVHPNDTLDKIAKRLNIPKKYFIRANNLKAPYKLKPGCVLHYPPVHVVKKDEKFEDLLKKYKLSENLLANHNDLKKPYNLKAGQILYLSRTPIKKAEIQKKPTGKPKIITPVTAKKIVSPTKDKSPEVKKVSASTIMETKTPPLKKDLMTSINNNSKFCWPIAKKAPILCPYGLLSEGKRNDGLNIKLDKGTPILASSEGEVVYVGDKLKNYGLLILIKHPNQLHTTYAHLDKTLVEIGQKVKKGQKIALSGMSGSVDTPQLHFEIRRQSKPVNPQTYLNKS